MALFTLINETEAHQDFEPAKDVCDGIRRVTLAIQYPDESDYLTMVDFSDEKISREIALAIIQNGRPLIPDQNTIEDIDGEDGLQFS